ncbi:MAG: DUF4118 domain-containing protein, partial [bacterium]|nr:DUF4118 domain-containing protein [bacterium]
LTGHNRADEIVKYAHARNVTKVIVGKTARPLLYRLLHGSVADEIQAKSGDIDIYVVPGENADKGASDPTMSSQATEKKRGYKRSALIVLMCTMLAGLMHVGQLAEANKVMVYLLGVVFIAARYGMGPGIFASIFSVILFDILMVRPYFSFAVNDTQYLLMFAVMLGIAILISALTARISQQAEMMRQRMQRTEALYRLSKQLAGTTGLHQLIATVEKELADMFQAEIIIYIVQSGRKLVPVTSTHEYLTEDFIERGVAHWVFVHGKVAGIGTDTLPQAGALYLPLIASQGAVGVLGISQKEKRSFLPDQVQLLETFAGQIAIALERDQFADQTKQMMIDVEAEKMRNALLSSISHDFRTPLSVIAATSQQLLSTASDVEPERRELIHAIVEEANRLHRYVDNLLEITRIESGNVKPDMQLNVIDDVIGSALNSRKKELATRPIEVTVPDDIPATMMDSVLIERVLINLLDNAIRYTPAGTQIEVSVEMVDEVLQVSVSDHGLGIPESDKERIFEKFYRHDTERGSERSGTGLGLAICHAIVRMHSGTIFADNNPSGGAKLTFTIPVTENHSVVAKQ